MTSDLPPLLILDLDECLIHAHESPLDRPGDFRVGPFHVYERPQVRPFLHAASAWFRLAIWSSATIDYVEAIVDQISPPDVQLEFVWGRDRCTPRFDPELAEHGYLKDLKKVKRLGFNLKRTLFVDDTPAKLTRHYGNAIYVKPFEGAADDDELSCLTRYLESIRFTENFRSLEKRGWRYRLQTPRDE